MRLATVAGIPVYIAPSSIVVAVVIAVLYAPRVRSEVPSLGDAAILVAGVFAVLLYASVLLHELAHALVSLRTGLAVRRMRLDLLGGFTETVGESRTPGRQALISAVGPATNLVLAVVGIAVLRVVPDGTVVEVLVEMLTIANLLVGIFNLLPGLPLDGGRVLAAAVWRVRGDRHSGTVVAAWAGRVIAVLLVAVTLGLPLLTGSRPTATGALFSVLIAWFVWAGASQALLQAQVRRRLPRLVAGALARPAIGVPAGTPLSEALRRLADARARGLVVVDAAGRPVALADEAAVTATPLERRPWLTVDAVSRRVDPGLILAADLAGEPLVAAIAAAPATEYLVVGPDGTPVGVLATADVERAAARR
jgi:Zn-dependent protease